MKIKVEKTEEREIPRETEISLEMIARKTIDGNIVVKDHPDIDIIVMPAENKIITFPKTTIDDLVYETQDTFFRFLSDKGVIDRSTVRAGNVYGSLQADIAKPVNEEESPDPIQLSVFTIGKFLEKEKPIFDYHKEMEDLYKKDLTDPSEEDSTELGEVPHEEFKGSIRPGMIRRLGYGFYYIYEHRKVK